MSNAVDRPVCPCSSRKRKRSFVSSAVPNPANCRIVHRRPRYIDGYTPRVKGNWPGYPRSRSWSRSRSAGFDSGSTSRPEIVENSCGSRCGVRAYRSRQTSRPLPCSVCAIGPIVARNHGSSTADGPRAPSAVLRVGSTASRAPCPSSRCGRPACRMLRTSARAYRMPRRGDCNPPIEGSPTAVPPSREQAPRHDVRCAHG